MDITWRKKTELEDKKKQGETDAQISLEFLEEYKKLCKKYKRDFMQGEVHIVKVEFVDNENIS